MREMFKCIYRRNRMIFYDKKHKETGKEYAYRVLKGNIMSLELKPGELLSESDLKTKNITNTYKRSNNEIKK